MPSRDERRIHYDDFVAYVRALCTVPRIRADLEIGRGRPITACASLHPHLSRRVHGHGARRAHYTVASLVALERPHHRAAPASDSRDDEASHLPWHQRRNLGATLAHVARLRPSGAGPMEKRLQTLTRLSADWLHPRLPRLAVQLLDAGCLPDWSVLLDDLAQWDFDRPEVATRWLDAFYLALPEPEPDDGEDDDLLEEQ
ncbi:type I-E CRISPR-associated protein Cse2/CasB [Streptomyces sp. NPDC001820]|uniref:type I-E CRISPR-associated protein Cse2/CasB n=1 Tax=Streptomyces sp. NPDC001820 TaxID=3364613 RepID=UPI00367DC075